MLVNLPLRFESRKRGRIGLGERDGAK